jgi:hypothetical protein
MKSCKEIAFELANKMGESPGFEDLTLAYVCTKFLETLIACVRQSIF